MRRTAYVPKKIQIPCWPNRRMLITALPTLALAMSPAKAAEQAGEVEALRGQAFAQTGNARRALAVAAGVFVGDAVTTQPQSAVSLRLGAGTLVRLGPEASLRIDRYLVSAGGVLDLARGAMVFERDPATPRTDTAVRSPFGLIAVRGTKFFAGPSNGVFGVFVARGEVAVVGANTAVVVGADYGTDIATPGGEPSNPVRWGAPRVQRAFASIE